MTSNRTLGAKNALELLEMMQATARECAATEEKLNYESRIKVGRERQKRDETEAEEAARLAESLERADKEYRLAKATLEAKNTARRAFISRARTSSKEQNLENIEQRTGSRKYQLQRQLMDAERGRDANLVTEAGNFEHFNGLLANENAAMDLLEKKARGSVRGCFSLRRLLIKTELKEEPANTRDRDQTMAALRAAIEASHNALGQFRKQIVPWLFRFLPVWLLLPLCATPIALQYFHQVPSWSQPMAIKISAGAAVGVVLLYIIGTVAGKSAAVRLAKAINVSRNLYAATLEKSAEHNQRAIAQVHQNFGETTQRIDADLKQALRDAANLRGSLRETIDDKTVRATAFHDRIYRAKISKVEQDHTVRLTTMQQAAELRRKTAERQSAEHEAQVTRDLADRWTALENEWRGRLKSAYDAFASAHASAAKLFPPWSEAVLKAWKPPAQFEQVAKFAEISVDLAKLCEVMPKDERLPLPGPAQFQVPLQLTYPDQGSILFETGSTGRDESIGELNNIILRLLATAPPGRLSFTVIDPVGLGQNFAGVMHLADYGERLINSRIWTQPVQIEEKLAELNEHMEKVIQMYLRNEYQTITEYNAAAGNIAERYHFLVVADFPSNFSDVAAKRLLSIASSGARCGVYTLIHWNHRQPALEGFVPDLLRKSSACLSSRGGEFTFSGKSLPGTVITLDPPPNAELATEFTHQVGRVSRDSTRVEVPFSQVTPPEAEIWSEETTSELRVPIGRTGATKLQYLAIGKGTRQHALIAGKTGSGKSTLFHVIITNLALWCSPEQVEFYLVDFKKGVEFKCYASKKLPHARVVAIESDREFGLSVLQRVDDELKRRGEMFRKLGVQDIPGYKRAGGTEAMPRSLLLIDEFQELFVEDDKISQGASVLLDRIVRQGRAFGIHVILGSQTLGGAYTVARTTLGQMVIRIALQCNEADAYLIMDDTNPAPRLLTRPGEGIYNDSAGAIEGNSPFQAVWLSDEIRDQYLDQVQAQVKRSGKTFAEPLVFEGDAPGEISENQLLKNLLEAPAIKPTVSARIWLGSPNSIKGPTEAEFHRQSGNHLLIVGQRDEAALTMLALALVALSAQYPLKAAKFFLFDAAAPGSPQREFIERWVAALPHPVTLVKPGDLADVMNGLGADLKERQSEDHGGGAPATFLLFNGLQKMSKLRHEDSFGFSDDAEATPSAQLNSLICEGASLGFHVIATCDTYNNVNRFLSKKAFTEFEMRVLFQMSANDSANLCDSPRAGSLGLHRALFYNEQEGYLETFRPYAQPDGAWLEQAKTNLARLHPAM